MTIRLENRREVQRELARLELEYDTLWDASAAELHTAIVDLALEHPEKLVEKVEELR